MGQVEVSASLKHNIDILALGEPFLCDKIAQNTVQNADSSGNDCTNISL